MLSKKDKANPLLMESRKLLLNQVDVGEDGRLNAVDEIRTFRYGAAEGEHKVRISGITTRDFLYRTKYNRAKAVYQASEAMKNIGRRANLKCMNDAAACIIKSPVFYPVVIVFYENSDGRMQLSAFTAKAFMSLFAINSALKKFDRELPDAMVRKVSVHSVHDVNRAIIHSLKSLVSKEDDNNGINDDREYVDLKKLFKAGRRKRRGSGNLYNGEQESLGSKRESLDQDVIGQEDFSVNNNRSYESRQERKARRKAERLEKKREAARRKYEKLMGEELVMTPVVEAPSNTQVVDESLNPLVNEGYYEEENDDIMMEFTGMTTDEFNAMDENGGDDSYSNQNTYNDYDTNVYDNYESDEDTLRELTGMSSDEIDSYDDGETDEDIMREFTGMGSNDLYD
ncbi:MAG: hypothetical protein IJ661_06275 [Lachnospiraceae bacterium]|nr:hypothetical protein [Lachnospiraceae bacterium]